MAGYPGYALPSANYTYFDGPCVASVFWQDINQGFQCAQTSQEPRALGIKMIFVGGALWEWLYCIGVFWRARQKYHSAVYWVLLFCWLTFGVGGSFSIAITDLFGTDIFLNFKLLLNVLVAMSWFKMCYQISFSVGVAIRARAVFPHARIPLIIGGSILTVNILFAIAQEGVEIYYMTHTSGQFDDQVRDDLNKIFAIQCANLALEVTTDIVLSLAFFYKLAEGLSLTGKDIFSFVTNEKVMRMLVGWAVGIAAAVESNSAGKTLSQTMASFPFLYTFWGAWQLHTFTAFSFEEIKTLVQKHTSAAKTARHGTGSAVGTSSEMERPPSKASHSHFPPSVASSAALREKETV